MFRFLKRVLYGLLIAASVFAGVSANASSAGEPPSPEGLAFIVLGRMEEEYLYDFDRESCREEILNEIQGRTASRFECFDVYSGYLTPAQMANMQSRLRGGRVGGSTVSGKRVAPNIGYISVSGFTHTTADEFEDAVARFGSIRRLVVDVRANHGGVTDGVLEMLYYFSANPDDTLLTERYRGRTETATIRSLVGSFVYPATREKKIPGRFRDYTVAIITDGETASAAEIFAGTMRDWGERDGRFFTVGRTTYGKGVAQMLSKLPDGGGLKLTVSEFFVGNSRVRVHGAGIPPTHPVADTRRSSRDTATERDQQFTRAVELVR